MGMKDKKSNLKDLGIDEKTHHQYRQTKHRQEQRHYEDIDRAIRNKDYSRLMDEDLY